MSKRGSYLQSFMWVGVLLLVMGLLFGSVGVATQFLITSPGDVNLTINGVRQPPTMETLHTARLLFLSIFGGFGLLLTTPGLIICACAIGRRRLARRLKAEGVHMVANVVGYASSGVRVNSRRLERLRCAYTDETGTTYVFKSGLLRVDPAPFLLQGKVDVYCDRDKMSRYFVDVDGSIGLGDRVVEL